MHFAASNSAAATRARRRPGRNPFFAEAADHRRLERAGVDHRNRGLDRESKIPSTLTFDPTILVVRKAVAIGKRLQVPDGRERDPHIRVRQSEAL
jgi:hypothetical protein